LRRRSRLRSLVAALLASSLVLACGKPAPQKPAGSGGPAAFAFERKPGAAIEFLSTQLNPVDEAAKMRTAILKDFPGKVDFRPNDSAFLYRQVDASLKAEPSRSFLIGALHGDFVKLRDEGRLLDLSSIYAGLGDRGFIQSFVSLARLGGEGIYYIPWMQASYVLAVDKRALKYLPEGVDARTLTYDQLYRWAVAILEGTGKFVLGFPAGEKGLMHRFLQGYLYPSFTGSALREFRSPEAAEMWAYLRKLWRVTRPASLDYSTMADPLIAGDVWIAWDHCARLAKAFEARPGDFVALPAPSGPKGRGFIAVVSGLGIPKGVADPRDAAVLIDYLTRPAIQERMLEETGFFPVLAAAGGSELPPNLRELVEAVRAQAESGISIPTLLPIGLGEKSDEYNKVFMLAFSDIILGGRDIPTVLASCAARLQAILNATGARFWPPDASDGKPGRIE
jgi:multiple sugar transport system substrate-binding protein